MLNILFIEDDLEFAGLLEDILKRYGFNFTIYDDPFLGLSANVSKFDLVILDLTLPGMDGLEVCKKISQYYDVPIIVSSARSEIVDTIKALEFGADDYLLKPYNPLEMYARITALLRRYNKVNTTVQSDNIFMSVDNDKCIITFKNEILDLTPAEFDILSELYKYKGNTVSREQILFSSKSLKESTNGTLNVIINRLRQKLQDGNKRYIKAIRGEGYLLAL